LHAASEREGGGGCRMRVAKWNSILATSLLLCLAVPLESDPSSDCIQDDPSATFSADLGLPNAPSGLALRIREAISTKDFARAEGLLEKLEPSADSYLWRGILLLHKGKTYAAIRSLEQSAQLQETSTVETLLAVAYLSLNQRLLVQDAVHAALRLEPQNPRALYLQGRFDFMTHSYERAIADLKAVLATEPNDYSSWYYLGFSEWLLGRNDSAREHFLGAIEILNCHHLDFWPAPYALSKLELDSGAKEPALARASLAIEMVQGHLDRAEDVEAAAEILGLRGKIESSLGREKDAESDWRQAVKLNPAFASGWYSLGLLYRRQGRTADATEAMQQFRENQ
jgi:tetratricopeptide (TPR) repeat protein